VYSPPYLFKGARPAISSAPTSIAYGQSFFVGTPNATSISTVTMIALGSVTHGFNMGQRISRPAFSQATGGLNLVAPSNPNTTPPGYYIHSIFNSNCSHTVHTTTQPNNTATPTPTPTPTPTATASPTPTPAAPTSLVATAASSSQINLTWTDNSTNETGFKVERSVDNTTFTQIGTVGVNVKTYASTGLTASTKYYYRVRAYNSGGNSVYSNTANATKLPTSISTLTRTPTPKTYTTITYTTTSP